jgi:short-subunit dehydrogenase
MTLLKDLANQTGVFAEVKPIAVNGDYPGSILSAMLQNRQCVIDVLINWALAHDSNDAAHTMFNLAELPL